MEGANPCTTLRVVDAAVAVREIPLRRPLRGARGAVTSRTVRLLSITADDGTTGVGDASRVDWLAAGSGPAATDDAATGAALDAAPDAAPGDDALALLVERIRSDAPPAAALLQWSLDPTRPSSVRCALQTALLDADARRRGLSLASFLIGGAHASAIATSALVGDDGPAAMAREAAALAALGVGSFKVKVGRAGLDDDVAAVAAVRGAIGANAELRLDANGAWDLAGAAAALRELAAFAPAFVEEPLRDAARVHELAAPFPVALDESLRDAAALDRALARGGFALAVLKLERVGGPLPALAMAARAARAGLAVVFTDSIDGDVGRAATLHVAAAAAARAGLLPRAVGLGGLFLLLDDGGKPCAAADLQGPGLGVTAPREPGNPDEPGNPAPSASGART